MQSPAFADLPLTAPSFFAEESVRSCARQTTRKGAPKQITERQEHGTPSVQAEALCIDEIDLCFIFLGDAETEAGAAIASIEICNMIDLGRQEKCECRPLHSVLKSSSD